MSISIKSGVVGYYLLTCGSGRVKLSQRFKLSQSKAGFVVSALCPHIKVKGSTTWRWVKVATYKIEMGRVRDLKMSNSSAAQVWKFWLGDRGVSHRLISHTVPRLDKIY